MNRPEFLSTAATATAVLATPKSLRAAEGSHRIPIGLLGATSSHGPDKIKLPMTSPDWEFVGVCEASEAGRQTCAKLGAKLISQDELLEPLRTLRLPSAAETMILRDNARALFRP